MKLFELFEDELPAKKLPKKRKIAGIPDQFDSVPDGDAELIALLKQHCRNNLKSLMSGATPLYREQRTHDVLSASKSYKFTRVSKRSEPRSSQTSTNLTLSFVAQSSKWAGLPSRAISSSCSVLATPGHFAGEVWLVIPYDNVSSYAVIPEDFNELDFMGNGTDLLKFSSHIAFIFSCVSILNSVEPSVFPVELLKILNNGIFQIAHDAHSFSLKEIQQLSHAIEALIYYFDDHPDDFGKRLLSDLKERCECLEDDMGTRSIWEWLNENVIPTKFDCKVFNSFKSISADSDTSEIWFSGDFVGIRRTNTRANQIIDSPWLKEISDKVES